MSNGLPSTAETRNVDSQPRAPVWTDLCALSTLPPEGGKYVTVGNRPLAVFRAPDDGSVAVLDDTCPHAGGSLSNGHLDAATGCVFCPWHAWPFELRSGRCPDNPSIGVGSYPVRIVDGRVQADLGQRARS